MAHAINDRRDRPLGVLLTRLGLVAGVDVTDALVESRTTGKRLGEVLVDWGLVSDRDLGQLLAEQEELAFVDLGKYDVDPVSLAAVPRDVALVHHVVPFALDGEVALVAVADPTDTSALDAVLAAASRRVRFVVATRAEIDAALAEAFAGC